MAPTTEQLCDDLAAETADLRGLLVDLDEAAWRTPTPAEGWSVLDQVTHLAFFDDAARRAAVEAEAFRASLAGLRVEDVDPDAVASAHRHLSGAEALAWFDAERARLLADVRPLDARARLPWYGPDMSLASSLTARLMETWAHGQDVADALGATREPTDRLRHVAHLGVRTRGFTYVLRGREVPEAPVRVELGAPSGGRWAWGPDDAVDAVRGPALDFCLLVTQASPPRRPGARGRRPGRAGVGRDRPGVRRGAGSGTGPLLSR